MPRNNSTHNNSLGDTASGFSSKREWLHNDKDVNEGMTYDVRYIGCLEIKTSMKMLDFSTRSQVAKECINRVCEAASLKSSNKKRRVDKRVLQCIADKPHMEKSGTNVLLTISSDSLSLICVENEELIAKHEMPKISFASGGDTDTLDFVAYVAKDESEWRACYVLECGGGLAQDLIATIGQAFEVRYNEFFNKTLLAKERSDKEYYNDLPGKIAPETEGEQVKIPKTRNSSNLIDLNSPTFEHNYVNDNTSNLGNSTANTVNDVFETHTFSLSHEVQRSQLLTESWYHGPISRVQSEALLRNDGDFLVRESQGSIGQYVLTGMQSTSSKHLLLIDPEGIVRTKDRIFESISHLINYHWTNALPIISAESALLLRTPIIRTTDLK